MGQPLIELFAAVSVPRITVLEALARGTTIAGHGPSIGWVDTGASRTNVQKSVLDRLGLEAVGEELVHTASTAGEPKQVGAYAVQLFLAGVPVAISPRIYA